MAKVVDINPCQEVDRNQASDAAVARRARPTSSPLNCKIPWPRRHSSTTPWQEPGPEVAPLAERIEWYMKRDEFEASAGKVVQLNPPGKHDGKD